MNQLNGMATRLGQDLEESGLGTLGWFAHEGKAGMLIGNRGGAMWPHFSASAEFADGQGDPLDRWTRRIIGEMAGKASFRDKIDSICFPFGMPVFPFQQWAMQATGNRPSPLGILVDPEYGLWWGLRAALLFDDAQLVQQVLEQGALEGGHPCDACADKSCLTTCPVEAFVVGGAGEKPESKLDVERCFSHLDSDNAPDCMALGCQARAACPVGKYHAYGEEQLRFHMRAFRG